MASEHATLEKLLAGRKAILFDLDGTLVDSNELHAQAWAKVLRHHGHALDTKDVLPYIGKGGDKLLSELVGVNDERTATTLSEERGDLFKREFAPRVHALAGSRDLIKTCRNLGLQVVVATAAKKDEFRAIVQASGLDDLLQTVTTSSDAERTKPDPDVVEAALELAHIEPDEAILIGDTPYDIEAGLRAGVPVIAFRSGGWTDASLKGASIISDGPAAMAAALHRL